MSPRYKLEHVNEITGSFVIVVAIILIAVLVGMAYSQRWFQRTIALQIVMPPSGAGGIRQGADVEFLGTSVGSVSDVVLLRPSGRMIAKTNIRDDYFPFIRQDSVASIKKSLGIAGSSYFDIARGQGPALPRTNAAIDCQEQAASVESSIEQIRKEVMPVLEKVRDAVNTYAALGARLNELMAGIQQGKGTAGRLVSDPAVADNLKSILEKVNASMEQVQNVLKEVQTASTHVSSLSQSVDRQVQQDLPGLILQIQQTVQEMETLIKGIEGVWPIRSHIPPRQSNTRIPPGEVAP